MIQQQFQQQFHQHYEQQQIQQHLRNQQQHQQNQRQQFSNMVADDAYAGLPVASSIKMDYGNFETLDSGLRSQQAYSQELERQQPPQPGQFFATDSFPFSTPSPNVDSMQHADQHADNNQTLLRVPAPVIVKSAPVSPRANVSPGVVSPRLPSSAAVIPESAPANSFDPAKQFTAFSSMLLDSSNDQMSASAPIAFDSSLNIGEHPILLGTADSWTPDASESLWSNNEEPQAQ